MSDGPKTSYGTFTWGCGHEGNAACATCYDDRVAEVERLNERIKFVEQDRVKLLHLAHKRGAEVERLTKLNARLELVNRRLGRIGVLACKIKDIIDEEE